MRRAAVYRNGVLAGILCEESRQQYTFVYDELYYRELHQPAISLTLPKSRPEYSSKFLFPCFFNMLSEGVNRKLQSSRLKIEDNDHFGLLLATAGLDTIGSLSIKALPSD